MNYPRAAVRWIDDNCLPNLARNSKRTCSMRWRCKWRTEKGGMRVIHKVTNSNNIEWGMSVMWPTLGYWFWNEARSAGPCYCMIIKVLSEDRNGSFSWSHETYFRILGCFKPKEDKLKKVKVLLQKVPFSLGLGFTWNLSFSLQNEVLWPTFLYPCNAHAYDCSIV